ncbi:Response regulator receiver protein [Syntrophobacter sp. SbD1]|nr:Response regulator receiver protein [Syntrophobacter sp. SbD1]
MGMEILIVDDEVEFAETFAERLELRGFTAHTANSGEEALRIVEECAAKVMVLDLKMPGMDGLEVLRRVKKAHPLVQVIILSGHGSEIDEAYGRSLGAFAWLRKPADFGDILEAVKRAEKLVTSGALQ